MKKIFFLFFLLFSSLLLFPQNNVFLDKLKKTDLPEVYVEVFVPSQGQVQQLADRFSIDALSVCDSGFIVTVWLSRKDYAAFSDLNIPFSIQEQDNEKTSRTMATSIQQMASWNRYPTYSTYCLMMADFQHRYPTLCRIDTILAATPNHHAVLAAHISNNIGVEEAEPQFFYTSTMHGDEIVGYIMMLRLIDYLLANYYSDEQVRNLVDNVKIWICPLENPDGTYYSGNNLLGSNPTSVRANMNGIDLNRSFPFPSSLSSLQPEVNAMIDFASQHRFCMSANLHGGAEVFNYPYDYWTLSQNPHADNVWFGEVGRRFAGSCHTYSGNSYFSNFGSGVTQGAAWYSVDGCRQDYMNYYQSCREVTLEVSNEKSPESSKLPSYWNYIHHALLGYIAETLTGFKGFVSDSITGEPIEATVFINDRDRLNSEVHTALPFGDYYRPIDYDTYSVTYSAEGYIPKTITVTVNSDTAVVQNVKLLSVNAAIQNEEKAPMVVIHPNPTVDRLTVDLHAAGCATLVVYDMLGKKVMQEPLTAGSNNVDLSKMNRGTFIFTVIDDNKVIAVKKVVKSE